MVTRLRQLNAKSIEDLVKTIGGRRIIPPSIAKVPGRFRKILYDDPAGWRNVRRDFAKKSLPGIEGLVEKLHAITPMDGAPDSEEVVEARRTVKRMASEPTAESLKEAGNPGQLDVGAVAEWEAGRLLTYFTKTKYHVDHIRPLAKHWVEDGWNGSDEGRRERASQPANLRYITAKWNTEKGSTDGEGEGYHYNDKPYIGEEFSSGVLNDNKLDGVELIIVEEA